MPAYWDKFQKYRYLIAASAVIVAATLALLLMQYRSARRTEAQARATLLANLDTHLLAIVDEAKRDMVEHADHVTHSITQRLVRDRDLPKLARAFTRASRRFPEVRDFFVVFFDKGQDTQNWRALRYVPPDLNDPATPQYLGVPIGTLTEDADLSEALRHAWLTVHDRAEIAVYSAYAPLSSSDSAPHQIFFHPVYEVASMDRQDDLDRVGLIAFTAAAEEYPAPAYLRNLVTRYESLKEGDVGLLGKLAYRITVDSGNTTRDLIATGNASEPQRLRRFETSDNLFPNLAFGVAPRDNTALAYPSEYARSSMLLGLAAAAVSLIGLGLTWRATRREMRVAQLKSDFLASISHELKTPLTAIRAFGDLLHSGRARDADRVREYGGLIKTESDRLTALINNILELSRLERGTRRYRLQEGLLCAAVATTVEVFRHTPEAKGCTIEVALPAPPLETHFEESAIRQALLNLLSNAAKYSGASDSERTIKVALIREPTEAVIQVRDFGIGISKSEQHQIFTPFHRAPQPDAQAKGGTGLGLAVVREVARAHGGKVTVESEPGAGATFSLHLPLLTVPEQVTQTHSRTNGHEKYLSN
jgi:signal transduction histidine kinase